MYEVIFENDNGKKFTFGPGGNNWFSMNIGEGMEVTLGKAQGFSQIGESVETKSISGRPIDVSGKFYGDIVERKNALRNTCAPLASGRLVFQRKYYIRVHVKAAPSFSVVKNNPLFKMQFYAPFPFFSELNESYYSIGEVVPKFRFPVNYGTEHRFGTRDNKRIINIINPGDVAVPFCLTIQSEGSCTNVTVTNVNTLDILKINGTIESGETIVIYRNADDILRAELRKGNLVTDVISRIAEESTFFELNPGENMVSANDDEGGVALSASFTFNPAVGVLYET